MKPKKAAQQINNILWNQFIEKEDLGTKSVDELILRLKTIKLALHIMYKKAMKDYPDNRVGSETYGYKDDESIKGDLSYISDRWNCAFRLRWLLDLIDLKR